MHYTLFITPKRWNGPVASSTQVRYTLDLLHFGLKLTHTYNACVGTNIQCDRIGWQRNMWEITLLMIINYITKFRYMHKL